MEVGAEGYLLKRRALPRADIEGTKGR